jgi:hypothetical protein
MAGRETVIQAQADAFYLLFSASTTSYYHVVLLIWFLPWCSPISFSLTDYRIGLRLELTYCPRWAAIDN